MKFKVGDAIYLKGAPSYTRRIVKITDTGYINVPIGPGSINSTLDNSIDFMEENFALVTKLELYLLGLENEENAN